MSNNIELESIKWARDNKKQFTKDFLANADYARHKEKLAIFMAGSPGAGKTEYSRDLVEDFDKRPLLVDPDELRESIPGYTGDNSSEVHAGVSILVDNLLDEIIKRKYSFVLDGTFSHEKALENVKRCINKDYAVQIHYLFQEAAIAWKATQNREIVEGRNIDKDAFIKHLYGSIENVRKAMERFGDNIKINIIKRNYENDFESIAVNETNIERYLPKTYNEDELKGLLE